MTSLNETYTGTEAEKTIIRNFLDAARLTRPQALKDHTSLDQARENRSLIDWQLFDEIINAGNDRFQKISDQYVPIPESRYMVIRPLEGSQNVGGFYGEPIGGLKTAGGYYGNQDVGFATILNPEIIRDRTLRTVELARDYLHDCLHAATFRTYRVAPESDTVYRHQYGVNFRTADGVGYSAAKLTEQSPHGINLNTWMDAAITLSVADFLKDNYSQKLDLHTADPRAKAIAQEILGLDFEPGILPTFADQFISDALAPTLTFEKFWDRDTPGKMRETLLHAMISGEVSPIKAHFAYITGQPDAWERIFKQKAYVDPPEIKSEIEAVSGPEMAMAKNSLSVAPTIKGFGAGTN